MTITFEEIAADIEQSLKGNPEAMTAREIEQKLNLPHRTVMRWLNLMNTKGLLVAHRVMRPDISGRINTVPAYTFKKPCPLSTTTPTKRSTRTSKRN